MKIKFIFFIIIGFFLYNFNYAIDNEKKQIKVVIEGEEEKREKDISETSPYIIWEKYNKEEEKQKLKSITLKSNIEQEILDAFISKIIVLESEIRRLKIYILILTILLILNIFFSIYLKKKK